MKITEQERRELFEYYCQSQSRLYAYGHYKFGFVVDGYRLDIEYLSLDIKYIGE